MLIENNKLTKSDLEKVTATMDKTNNKFSQYEKYILLYSTYLVKIRGTTVLFNNHGRYLLGLYMVSHSILLLICAKTSISFKYPEYLFLYFIFSPLFGIFYSLESKYSNMSHCRRRINEKRLIDSLYFK